MAEKPLFGWRWVAVLAPGLILYLAPVPGLNLAQRHLLAIFVATIVALVAQPVPMGVSVVVSMTLLALTGTLPPAKVLSGFSNPTLWLIFVAFLFGRAFTVTGLGRRIGYLFVQRFARGPLSLGYSLAAADLLLAALPLACFSSLNAGLTHYGTGSAPVFFSAGYVSQSQWWRIGFLISLVDLAIWLGAGMAWWKIIGIW